MRRGKRKADGGDGRIAALVAAFRSPTSKQREAYARYLHTLSAAGVIGAMTLLFSESPLTAFAVLRAVAMLAMAVVLFGSGAIFSKGDP